MLHHLKKFLGRKDSPATSTHGITIHGIPLKKSYSNFAMGEIIETETEHPGLGATIRYHGGPHGEATVYIYDRGLSIIPDGTDEGLIRLEFDVCTQEVLKAAPLLEQEVELIERYGTISRERGSEFFCAAFYVLESSGRHLSYLYVTGARGKFVKLRVTLPTDDLSVPTARHFADEVAANLWS